jgi:hypothetical protein
LIDADALFVSRRDHLVALVARHSIPAIYDLREFAAAGGLMSYGASRCLSPRRWLHRPDSQRCRAGRTAGPASGESRVRDQSQDGQGAPVSAFR